MCSTQTRRGHKERLYHANFLPCAGQCFPSKLFGGTEMSNFAGSDSSDWVLLLDVQKLSEALAIFRLSFVRTSARFEWPSINSLVAIEPV